MRRTVLLLGVAALAVTVLPVPALAEPPFSLGGVPCSLIPVPAANAPVGTGTCPGVRPGGRLVTKVGLCTLNFLFQAPDGTRYIGTAGQCVPSGSVWPHEKVWPRGGGPVAEDAEGKRIGEFVYIVMHGEKDFALIRIDPGIESSPEMCVFGAPHGVYRTDTAGPLVLHYYGNGVGADNVVPARSGVALGTPNPDHVYAVGLSLPGDAGSGVMTADGLAVGVLVSTGLVGFGLRPGPFNVPTPTDPPRADEKGVDLGTMGLTRLGPQMDRASEMLGVPLELVTGG